MKRRKIVVASDNDTTVRINIHIDARNGLMRDEVDNMAESLASKVMEIMPLVRHFHVPLSKVRVR